MEWILISQPPPPLRKLLATFVNGCGKRRIILAEYVPAGRRANQGECDDDDDNPAFWPEGWYECTEYNDECVHRVSDTITHYQSLPTGPEEK